MATNAAVTKQCNECGDQLPRDAFSKSQWKKNDVRKCITCLEASGKVTGDTSAAALRAPGAVQISDAAPPLNTVAPKRGKKKKMSLAEVLELEEQRRREEAEQAAEAAASRQALLMDGGDTVAHQTALALLDDDDEEDAARHAAQQSLSAGAAAFVPRGAGAADSNTMFLPGTRNAPAAPLDEEAPMTPLDLLQIMFSTRFDTNELLSALEQQHYDMAGAVHLLLAVRDGQITLEQSAAHLRAEQEAERNAQQSGGAVGAGGDVQGYYYDTQHHVTVKLVSRDEQDGGGADARRGSNNGGVDAYGMSAPPTPVTDTRPICRYYILGDCRLKNCQFRHADSVACKYWLRSGECMRGDSCRFVHTYNGNETIANELLAVPAAAASSSRSANVIAANQWPTLGDAPMAGGAGLSPPAFGSSGGSNSGGGGGGGGGGAMSLANRVKLGDLQQRFAWLPEPTITYVLEQCQWDANAAAGHLSANYPPPQEWLDKQAAEQAAAAAPRVQLQHGGGRVVVPTEGADVPWLETGENVGEIYAQWRREAIEHAVERNRMFELAAQAFQRGDGRSARDLSRRGRQHDAAMKELHERAANAIFEARNFDPSVLDLHGLHVQEALLILERKIEAALRARGTTVYHVVTGTGHHSGDNALNTVRLDPAVKRFLADQTRAHRPNLSFTPESRDGRGGAWRLSVRGM